ncbi:MAG: hypothetical protein U9N60_10850 [Thermodesulfobacteriota bacterium]|nr:hypothetical protein [Thermodesulfobacteriota bacterium]
MNIGKILSDVVIENAAIDNLDSEWLYKLEEMGMSINQIININNNKATSNSTAKAEATNTVSLKFKIFSMKPGC